MQVQLRIHRAYDVPQFVTPLGTGQCEALLPEDPVGHTAARELQTIFGSHRRECAFRRATHSPIRGLLPADARQYHQPGLTRRKRMEVLEIATWRLPAFALKLTMTPGTMLPGLAMTRNDPAHSRREPLESDHR
jgi:hypothetical protein